MALSTRKGIFNLSKAFLISESHRLTRVFSLNSFSQPSEDAGELFRKGGEGESHKDIEAVSDVGNRVHEITENIKETAQESMERTGQKIRGNERDLKRKDDDESIMEGPEDEERLKKKLEKEKGGKPVDEDKGLDVNWRPIDENKSPSH